MSSNILDYIILIIIFVLLINLFIGNKQSCSENMASLKYNEAVVLSEAVQNTENLFSKMVKDVRKDVKEMTVNNAPSPKTCGKIVSQINIDNNSNNNSNNNNNGVPQGFNEDNELYASIKDVVPKHDVSSRTVACPVNKMNDEFDKYVKDIALGGKFLCTSKGEKISDDKIQKYQDDFFGFNNKINNSSSMGFDTVDKIHEGFTSDIKSARYDGMNISAIYKDLTKNDAVNTNCTKQMPTDNLIEPQVDNLLKTVFYSDDSAKFYSNYNWKYKNDNVNNGGKFYGNIEASDNEINYNMMYKPDATFKKLL